MVRTPPTENAAGVDNGSSSIIDDGAVEIPDSAAKRDPADQIARTPIVKDPAAVAIPSSEVLAVALTQADEQSYSFEVGMEMHTTLFGMQMTMAPEGPVMSGAASGDRMYAVMDLGAFMSGVSITDENGEPMPIPELDELDDMQFEMWLDGTVMTMDMSDMADMDSTITGAAAQGPVSFDLAELEGVGVDDITAEMLDSPQSMDPAAAAELLRGLDSVVEVGTDELAGRTVTVYQGTLSMKEYAEATGEALTDLAGTDELGMLGDEEFVSAFESMTVDLTVMIDEDDLLRRFEMFMDMSPMFEAMMSSESDFELIEGEPRADIAEPYGPDDEGWDELDQALLEMQNLFTDIDMSIFMWMEFGDYGESFEFDPPPSVDLTDDVDSLFGGSLAA